MIKYKHEEVIHNLKDPSIIVPEIKRLLDPKSVVDFGCGIGTFLSVFKSLGVRDILGIDGSWTNKELLYKYISPEEFKEFDLEKEIKLDKKYDLALCLEVAEHLSEDAAEIIVQNLVNSGQVILFSAAIPFQGGQNHVNEQWLTYWEEKFARHNYVMLDILRPIFWDNSEIYWWYKQNMVLVTPENYTQKGTVEVVPIRNIVHYELYEEKAKKLNEITRGEESASFYIKRLLYSLFGYKSFQRIKRLVGR